jgi:hypothetical protein
MEVIFLALDSPDDVNKVLSMELTGAWLNEAREIPKSILDALTGRVGRFPPKRDGGGCTWSGILMDTNPPDSDHWWYTLAEKKTPEEFRFFSQPGGLDPHAENLENLPDRYYARAALGKDPDWVKVYINGEYGFVTDGKPVYPEYSDRIHCADVSYTNGLPLYVGIDFGLTPAAVIGQKSVSGQVRCLSEVVTEDMGIKRFSDVLSQHLSENYPHDVTLKIIGDPAGVARSQTDEKTVFDILHNEGFDAIPAETNEFRMRRESFGVPMTRMIDGEPGFVIDAKCTYLRKGLLGGYAYKRKKVVGREQFHDKPDKGKYSHVCDAGQYMTLGMGEGVKLIQRDRKHENRQRVANMDYDPLEHNQVTFNKRVSREHYDPFR